MDRERRDAAPGRGGFLGILDGIFFKAAGNEACVLRIGDGFKRYTGGRGGASGALNRIGGAAARIDLIGALPPAQ